MAGLIDLSREAGATAADAVSAALVSAGRHGATVAELLAATGLPERRCQRAVARLAAEGRARRDGDRGRVFALADDQGHSLEADDRRTRELADRRARREFEARRGYVAGELADALGLLDGRRIPAGLGGSAESARRYLRQAVRDVRSVPDPETLERLVAESRPAIEAVGQVLAAVEDAKRHAAQGRVAERERLAELKDERRRLAVALARIEAVQDRVAAVSRWEAYRAWEVVKRSPAVLGRPLLVAGKWQPARGGLWGALSTTGQVPVSCPLTGAETAFPATAGTGGSLTVRPDLGVLAELLEGARVVVGGWLRNVDRERLALRERLVSAPALTYDASPRMTIEAPGRSRPAFQRSDSGSRQRQPTAVSARREPCGWCGKNPAPSPGLPCPACVRRELEQPMTAWA